MSSTVWVAVPSQGSDHAKDETPKIDEEKFPLGHLVRAMSRCGYLLGRRCKVVQTAARRHIFTTPIEGLAVMLPVSSESPSAEEARQGFIAAKKWWEDETNLEKVHSLAHGVRCWLLVNKQRTDKRGDEKSEPWWGKVPATEDPVRIDLRRSSLRQLIFGTGIRRLLNRMVHEQLLSDGAYDFIDEATDFAPMALHEELMGYKLSENPGKTLTLEEVKDWFGLAEGTNSTKKRPFTLKMATFGLWTVILDKDNHYAISVGPVAELFHREVFTPVRVEFEQRIRGCG